VTEAVHTIERMVDIMAHQLGTDPAEFRMKNFIKPEQFPYKSALGWEYDSGNYAGALHKAMDTIGYADLRREQAEKRKRGELMGIGDLELHRDRRRRPVQGISTSWASRCSDSRDRITPPAMALPTSVQSRAGARDHRESVSHSRTSLRPGCRNAWTGRADDLGEARDADAHQLPSLALLRLLAPQIGVADRVHGLVQGARIVAAVVLPAERRLVGELLRLDEVLHPNSAGSVPSWWAMMSTMRSIVCTASVTRKEQR